MNEYVLFELEMTIVTMYFYIITMTTRKF